MRFSLMINLVITLLLMVACTGRFGKVIRVNSSEITELDIEYRAKVARYYFPEYQGDITAAAKVQMINAFILAEILKNNGRNMDQEALKKEAERIKASSLMPEKLEQIRALFGTDEAAYLKVYVLPVLAERTIFYDFFLHDPKVQEQSLTVAQNVLTALQNGKGNLTERLASLPVKQVLPPDYKGKPFDFVVSLKTGLNIEVPRDGQANGVPPSPQQADQTPAKVKQKMEQVQANQQNEEGKKWLNEVIRPLKDGQIYDKVVDRQESWWIVRLKGRDKNDSDLFRLEAIAMPKANYEKWLEAEKQKIKVVE